MRNKAAVLAEVRSVVEDMYVDVGDLVSELEITMEEVMDRFEDKLLLHADKFLVGVTHEEEGLVEEDWWEPEEE